MAINSNQATPKHYRKSLRAPLYAKIFLRSKDVLSSNTIINISSGGLLLDEKTSKVDDHFDVLFLLPKLPLLSQIEPRLLIYYKRWNQPHELFKGRIRILRQSTAQMGCMFEKVDEGNVIDDYVKLMRKNLAYALSMFENDDDQETKRAALSLLGYGPLLETYTLKEIRSHLLHDYQNMV